jgi:uncharacterized protein (TIGR03083 family)
MSDDRALVDTLARAWWGIHDLCADLTEADWAAPTDCPGWSVKDHLSHIAGTEARLLGRPVPAHTPADSPHVHNEIGAWNEIDVDWRRPRSGPEVLAEFDEVTTERSRQLRSYTAEDFDRNSWTPAGPGKVRDFLAIRILDIWVHDQDIRRALGRPGHRHGPVVERTMGRLFAGMPYVVGKRVAPPDGTTVTFEVAGPAGRTYAVVVEAGRAKPLPEPPPTPSALLSMDQDVFVQLACGRGDAKELLDTGAVRLEGDEALGRAVIVNMNFMP